jgi:uncharacterized protein (TIRG00374 family)
LLILGTAFVLLTAAGVIWAARSAGLDAGVLARLGAVPAGSLVLVGGLAVAVLLSEMVRFRMFGWALGERLTWLACWDATVANFFFAWLTPGAALAEPATIYALHQRGVAVDVGLVVGFGKSFTSFLLLMGTTLALLACGVGPRLHPYLLLPFASGTAVLLALTGVVALGAIWPQRLTTWLDARRQAWSRGWPFRGPRASRALHAVTRTLIDAIGRAADLRRLGWGGWLAITASHLVYYAAFVGVFVVLAAALGASSVLATVPAAVIYQGFTYVAPTPGGSGLSEATATAFFGHVLAPEAAVLSVLLYRTVTFYLHIALGLVYLPIVGGIRAVVARDSRAVEDGCPRPPQVGD